MKNSLPILIFILVLIAVDLYAFRSFKMLVSQLARPVTIKSLQIAYTLISLLTFALLFYGFSQFGRSGGQKMNYYIFFMGFGIVILILIPKMVVIIFQLISDCTQMIRWLVVRLRDKPGLTNTPGDSISRWQFIINIGWTLAALPFIGILYGIVQGRFDFRIIKKTLRFSNFPKGLDGLRIVHISDIHIGSFFDKHKSVSDGLQMINDIHPDLILFTGDLVNNYANEVEGWVDVLSGLRAKYGKYSILGNHDYGDYVNWDSASAKAENLEGLKRYHKEIGFRLLLDENVSIEPNGTDNFELIGIQNWGLGGFAKYGDLNKALRGTNAGKFQLLMSHDPSHWDAQVLGQTDIDLTLSGHTHGMQFGVEIPGLIKWSPVKYRYPRWGGLYVEGAQHLYVNRGFGYIGFPGRVGMPPEITVIELKSED